MPTGYHEDHRSIKHLARLVVSGALPLPQFYAAAAERLVTMERAEKLLIETREQIDAERQAIADSAAQWAQSIIDARRARLDQMELPL